MDVKKLINFALVFFVVIIITLFTTLTHLMAYPVNILLYAGCAGLILFMTIKFWMNSRRADASLLPSYTYDTASPLEITILPLRVTLLSAVMTVLPFMMMVFFLKSIFDGGSLSVPSLIIGMVILLVFSPVFFFGIKLFQRRNNVVQLKIDKDGIECFPINIYGVGRGNGVVILSMYFRKKMRKIYYDEILEITIRRDKWRGDSIHIISKQQSQINLPFLSDDSNQVTAVYENILKRLQAHRSFART